MRVLSKIPVSKQSALIAVATAIFCSGLIRADTATAAGPPYEFQIGGALAYILETIVLGELTETRQPSVHPKPVRPACRPDDFERLKNAAGASNEIGAFLEKCKPAPINVGPASVEITMLLPSGYCGTINELFQEVLSKYRSSNDSTPPVAASKIQFHNESSNQAVEFTYKNARFYATVRYLLAKVEVRSTCDSDGSLRVVTPRKR